MCNLQISMRTDEQCKFLCVQPLVAARAKAFRTRVEEEYRVNMCVPQPGRCKRLHSLLATYSNIV
jgi:hypothetical protein